VSFAVEETMAVVVDRGNSIASLSSAAELISGMLS
jgi:hypothetical protein